MNPSSLVSAARDGKALASALMRSPININTAPYSVVVAALKGVRLNYDARVKAKDSQGNWSRWSKTWKFNTP